MMDAPKVELALQDIEKARREKRYADMVNYAHVVQSRLDDDTSEQAWRWRSRISYEVHMAEWQKGNVEESLRLARQSSKEADRGNDFIGGLFAEVNIGGHILPAQGKWKEGLALLMGTCDAANIAAMQPKYADELGRVKRVAMNAYALRIRLMMKHMNPLNAWVLVEECLQRLEENPIFASYRGQEWAESLVREATAFVKIELH